MWALSSLAVVLAQALGHALLLERITRMWRCRCEKRCHSVPSPLAGEGQGEGYAASTMVAFNSMSFSLDAQVAIAKSVARSASSPPLSLSLPRKGGGNRVARTFAHHGLQAR